ncbi:hypothetical protein, partial [Prevotella jejuni]|uniref:hypothetical protein n=1 Tax=Prevotella jejuni TaxID=1177574 RepID=UPI0028DBAF52
NKHHKPPDKESAAEEHTLGKTQSGIHLQQIRCDRSAVKLFSCHCRHSINTYNILINNVLEKNVKSDSK